MRFISSIIRRILLFTGEKKLDNRFNEYDKYLMDDEGNVSFSKKPDPVQKRAPVQYEDISSNSKKKSNNNKPSKPVKTKKNGGDNLKKGLGVLCGATGVLEALCSFMLIKLNMLPTAILALIIAAFALVLLIICVLMFMKSKNRFGKRKLAATILAVIMIISCLVGIFFMSKLLGTLDSVLKGNKISKADLDKPFIVYLSGSDTRNNQLSEKTRSDVNILAVVNPVTHDVLLLNTPRDYYVENPNCGNQMDKLTHCGLGGIESSMTALARLYDLEKIDYYGRINFTGFETLIDSIGGVDVYSDVAFTTEATSNVHINKGENHLNGFEALAFARERHALASGDFARGENQMKVIKAIVTKVTSSDALIRNYSGIMNSMSGMFETDTPKLLIQTAVKAQLSGGEGWNIQSFAVTGKSGWGVCASSGQKLSVVYRDEESINQAKTYINQVLNGEALIIAE